MLFSLCAESQRVDNLNDFPKVIAALDFVLNLSEDFPNLVFDCVGSSCFLLEAVEVGKEFLIYKVAKIVACLRRIMVGLAVLALRRGPGFPTVRLVQDEGVFLALEFCFGRLILFKSIQVLKKEQPRGLLGIIQFAG